MWRCELESFDTWGVGLCCEKLYSVSMICCTLILTVELYSYIFLTELFCSFFDAFVVGVIALVVGGAVAVE